MDYEEKTMKSENIYDGKILNLRIDTVELPNKKYSKREIVEHPDGVAIIPVVSDNSIVLVRQYRKAIEDFMYEIPAGKLEIGEEPREAAKRELEEETGLVTNELIYLSEFYTSPGFCNEKIYLFLAEGLLESDNEIETDEYIEAKEFTLKELIEMINRGEIIDSKTIIGIYAALEFFKDKI